MSTDSVPPLVYETIINGSGQFVAGDETLPVAAFTLSRAAQVSSLTWQFEARLPPGEQSDWQLFNRKRFPLRFEGHAYNGISVTIPELSYQHWQKGMMSSVAYEITVGERFLSSLPQVYHVQVELSETPIARRRHLWLTQSWTGEVVAEDSEAIPPLVIATRLGEFEFSMHCHYKNGSIGDRRALVQYAIPTLFIKNVDKHCESLDLDLVRDIVKTDIEPYLDIISLLSRRWVDVTQLTIDAVGGVDADRWNHRIEYGRAAIADAAPEGFEPMVWPTLLPQGALMQMAHAYTALPYRRSIRQAITHLTSVTRRGFLEQHLMSAFTALESLVSGVGAAEGTSEPIEKKQIKKVRKALKDALREKALELNLSPTWADDIEPKLGEIQRIPITLQVVRLIQRLDITWTDLWPLSTPLQDAISTAYTDRHALIHTGGLTDESLWSGTYLKIHALTERMIFRLLNGDDKWRGHAADQHLYGIAS